MVNIVSPVLAHHTDLANGNIYKQQASFLGRNGCKHLNNECKNYLNLHYIYKVSLEVVSQVALVCQVVLPFDLSDSDV